VKGLVASVLILGAAPGGYAQGGGAPFVVHLEARLSDSTAAVEKPWVLVLEGVRAPSHLGYQLTVRAADEPSKDIILGMTSVVGSPTTQDKIPQFRTVIVPLNVGAARLLSGRRTFPLSISVDFIGSSVERGLTIERAYFRRTQ
jgi:hypothetical protein